MTSKDIVAALPGAQLADPQTSRYTSKIVRGTHGDRAMVVLDAAGDHPLHAGCCDALTWYSECGSDVGGLDLHIANAASAIGAVSSLATLVATARDLDIRVFDALTEVQLTPPNFDEAHGATLRRWMHLLEEREQVTLPPLARRLHSAVEHPSFRWYLNVTANAWSGRVEGLQVCESSQGPRKGERTILAVGAPGRSGAESFARKRFRQLTGSDELVVSPATLNEAAALIEVLAHDRSLKPDGSYSRDRGELDLSDCEREHHLESRVLRGDLAIEMEGLALRPLDGVPFQFPTMWSEVAGEGNRLVDALMRIGSTPWVLEFKVNTGGVGQYYRHAVSQVVLYREFIRRSAILGGWFAAQQLDHRACQAAVVVPVDTPPEKLTDIRCAATRWGVAVIGVADRRDENGMNS